MSTISEGPRPWESAIEASANRPKPKVSRLQLAVYLAYGGNVDLYQIRRRPDPAMFNEAWSIISSLLQQIATAQSGLASEKYRSDVEAEVLQLTEDSATRDLLWAITCNRSTK